MGLTMSSRAMNKNTIFSKNTQCNSAWQLSNCQLWTALITPFDRNNQIDFSSLKTIAMAQARAGNGILLLGSTGEGLALTADEKFSIVQFVCNLKLNIPLMVAVGGYNLPEQINWIKRCNTLSIHSYLLSTPLYAKPGVAGQTHWFSALLDTASFPCMLYNVPSRSGVSIPVEALMNVQNHKNCWALKEASGDLNQFLNFRRHCPNIDIYSGEDGMLPYLASAGAKGLVSVCANAWPEATKHYVEQCMLNNVDNLFPLWNDAIDALFLVANPIPVKILMHYQNVITTPILRAPLTHLELTNHENLLAYEKKINEWFAESTAQHQFTNEHYNYPQNNYTQNLNEHRNIA